MHPVLRNILAVIAGAFVGGIVNFGIITISGRVIAPPEGVDVTDMESLKESMHLFRPKHFIFPFLAHAIGTLVGAYTAARIATKDRKMTTALVIGAFFLLGGIMTVIQLGGPMWFNIVDIVGAYIPMGWLGGKMASNRS